MREARGLRRGRWREELVMRNVIIAAIGLLCVGGCARYEYDIVEPADLARHIGDREEVVAVAPLEYRLRSYESRLVLNVENPTRDPVTLMGERSYVVAPNGQSHPLRTQTIAPGAFVKLILPPVRPYYRETGPTIGIGFGVGVSSARYRGGPWGYSRYGAGFYDEPRYITYYDESDATYWNWTGESDVKVHLVYQVGKDFVGHDFTFHRRKA
jgi:hypothetical protein